MSLGTNIRFLRRQRGMSQQQLADLCGYKSDVTVQHWETDRNEPKLETIIKLCEIFHITSSDLLTKDLNTENFDLYVSDRGMIIDMVNKVPENMLSMLRHTVEGFVKGIDD